MRCVKMCEKCMMAVLPADEDALFDVREFADESLLSLVEMAVVNNDCTGH